MLGLGAVISWQLLNPAAGTHWAQNAGTPLTDPALALALEIARLPEQIKGFGHVKERHAQAAAARREALLARWREGATAAPPRQAA